MPEVKRTLEDIVHSVLPEDIGASEIIIMHSPWGGGKTHALRYFEREIHEKGYGHAFYVGKVRLDEKLSFQKLYLSIVKECEDEFFKELANSISSAINEELFIARQKNPSAEEAEVISQHVSADNRSLVQLVSAVKESQEKIKQVFTSEIADDFSAASMMASLISVMTSPIGSQQPPYRAAYLFFDEVEDILDAKPTQSHSFWNSCRELINRIGENFAFILSFSAEAALLESILPPYLTARLTRPYVYLKQLTDEDALIFIKDFLRDARLEGFSPPQPFYPFSKEAIDLILDRETDVVPRKIILGMRRVFERAVRQERIGKDEEISQKDAQEILDEMGV